MENKNQDLNETTKFIITETNYIYEYMYGLYIYVQWK